VAGMSSRRMWIVGGLLLAAVVLILLAILPANRRYKFTVPGSSRPEPRTDTTVLRARTAPAHPTGMPSNGFAGGPPPVSVQLKPWTPPLRQSTLPPAKAGGGFNRLKDSKPKPSRPPASVEPQREETAPVAEPFFESVGPVLEQAPEIVSAVAPHETGLDGPEANTEFAEASTITPRSVESEILKVPEEPVFAAQEENEFSEHPREEAMVAYEQPNEGFVSGADYASSGAEAESELTAEPIGNDQPHEAISAEREAFGERDTFVEREAFAESDSFM